jgi:redox-sensing transcriptional repressor
VADRSDHREVSNELEEVSPLTLNRLSFYLRCLRHLQEGGVSRVSSQEMAQRYHLSATQIRKDLAQFGEFGIRGVGYDVDALAEHLVASDRWSEERAKQLVDDLLACGPVTPVP